jgi:hypothetical protein
MRNLTIALLTAALAAPAAAQQTMSFKITVGTNDRNGVCYVYLPTNPDKLEEPELEISVKADNGNVNVGMSKLPTAIDTPKMQETRGPVKLTFGKKKIKTDKGSLRSGYYYKYLGWWEDSKNGLPVLSALKDGTTVTVEFEGKKYGPIQIQQSPKSMPNYGYNHLKSCIKKNGGTVVF